MSAFEGQQRVYDDRSGSRWENRGRSPYNRAANEMQEDTEQEIMRAAFVSDEEFKADPVNAGADAADDQEQNDELVDEMSQVDGMDGRKLGIEEIAHRNMYGDDPNTDRPVELQDMEDAAEKMDVLQSQNAEQGRVIDSLLTGGAPSDIDRAWNSEMAAAHQRLENTGMIDPVDRQRMIDNHLRTQIDNQERLGQAKYGDEFSERYAALKQDATRSRQHEQYLKSILFNGQLAEGVMQYGPPRQQTRQQQQPPSRSRSRSLMDEMDEAGGGSSPEDEREIFASAWED